MVLPKVHRTVTVRNLITQDDPVTVSTYGKHFQLVMLIIYTQYMQNNLKNSLQLIHYRNVQRVICHIVNKEKGIVPDIDAFSHIPLGILLNLAHETSPSKDTLSNRSSRT